MREKDLDIINEIKRRYEAKEITIEQAIKLLRKQNSKHPYELTRLEIARFEIRRGNKDKAREIFQKIQNDSKIQDFKETAIYELSAMDAYEGNVEEAEERKKLLKRTQYKRSIDYKLAKTMAKNGDAEESKRRFEDIIEQEDNPGAYYHLAHMAIGNKDFETANKYVEELIALEKYDLASYVKAYILYASGDVKECKKEFTKLLNSKFALDAKYRLATLEFMSSDNEMAMSHLKELHGTSLNDSAIIYEAIILDSEGFHEEAIAKFLDVINNTSNLDQHGYISLANALSNLERYDEARKYLDMVNDGNLASAAFYKICNDIYEHKYLDALKKIDQYKNVKEFKGTQIWYYVYNKIFKSSTNPEELNYIDKQMRKFRDKRAIEHIEKHLEVDESKPIHTVFYNSIDIHSLYFEVRSIIREQERQNRNFTDSYIVKVDYPVGSLNGKETNYICVTTLPDSKDIITMYPMIVSKYYLERHNDTGRNGIEG